MSGKRKAAPEPSRGASFRDAVLAEWTLRPDELRVLELAASTLDEIAALEAALAGAPLTTSGSRGQARAHPLLAELRGHRALFRQLVASLGITEAAKGEADPRQRALARQTAGRRLAQVRWNG
ncbi:MAG TPA: hypothetical protein VGH82_17265 [Gaiellaceae bacterium]